MSEKPKRASEYVSAQSELVRATCLYVATNLGDMMDDLVIVGGLVPSLIVDQATLPEGTEAHVGTMDLDVGLHSWRCSATRPMPRGDHRGLSSFAKLWRVRVSGSLRIEPRELQRFVGTHR